MNHSMHNHAHDAHGHIADWSQLGFGELWSPILFLSLVVLLIVYLLITGSMRTRLYALAPAFPTWRKWMFALGLLHIYIAAGSPLAALGHHFYFSAHMMQQSMLYLVVPPLLLLGTPSWWFAKWRGSRVIERIIWLVRHPFFALLNFNVFFSFYHIPAIFDTLMSSQWAHSLAHWLLQLCALQMWLLVINPLPTNDRLRPLQKIGYIFANGVLLTPACALIIFADNVLYDTYRNLPLPFELLSRLDDQQLGGVIMKLMQEAVYGITLAVVFYRWYYFERAQEQLPAKAPRLGQAES